ncbi:MAG: GNAT family N-acetyltransferase [Fimbriimonas sp.]
METAVAPITLAQGILAFGRGFTFTRSFTHPYEFLRVGPVWVLRDGPRSSGEDRSREVIVMGLPPAEALPAILAAADGKRYFVCAVEPMEADFTALVEGYKALGYRLLRREPMMVRAPEGVAAVSGPYPIVRVQEEALAARVATAAGRRLILEEHLHRDDAPLRLYAALDGEEIAGWVGSVRTSSTTTWVANMMVRPEYRRQGVARSLMTHMLADDARLGYAHSVLLASGTGAKLYASVGYEQIALLQLFAPKKVPAS